MNKFGIVIPYHGERYLWTANTLHNVHNFACVEEFVINVEPSPGDWVRLGQAMEAYRKGKLYHNEKRLGAFRNKIEAVKRCRSEWVALIDSDNVITGAYFAPSIADAPLSKHVIYCPYAAMPKFDFSDFIGTDINLKAAVEILGRKNAEVLLNTGNYIFHRETWLDAVCSGDETFDPVAVDVLWANYLCMLKGMVMRVVPGMRYVHNVHPESTYLKNQNQSKEQAEKIKMLMRMEYEKRKGARGFLADAAAQLSRPSNFAATGGPSSSMVRPERSADPTELLTD